MLRLRALCRYLALPLVALVVSWSLPVPLAHAGLVPTERVLGTVDPAGGQRAAILDFLARQDVHQQMQALGVDPGEAAARVDALSDREVAQLADRIALEPAGGSVLGVILGTALVVFIVLLITDILGLTKVFPFTRSVR